MSRIVVRVGRSIAVDGDRPSRVPHVEILAVHGPDATGDVAVSLVGCCLGPVDLLDVLRLAAVPAVHHAYTVEFS